MPETEVVRGMAASPAAGSRPVFAFLVELALG